MTPHATNAEKRCTGYQIVTSNFRAIRRHCVVYPQPAGAFERWGLLVSIDTTFMREAMARRLLRRGVSTGKITLPAVPGMLDEYVSMCDKIFAALGRKFSTEERDHMRSLLAKELASAFSDSNRSNIVIS